MKRAAFVAALAFVLLGHARYAPAAGALRLELRIVSSRTLSGTAGDYVTVEGEIANGGDQAVSNITTYLSLVNADTKMPVDLEDWSAEKGLFIGAIDAKQTFPLKWKVHFVQSGNYTVAIVANVEGQDRPVISQLTYFNVLPKKNLNPGHVLPVALGEPILLVCGFLALRYWRDRKSRS
jgi:hypothetical protein